MINNLKQIKELLDFSKGQTYQVMIMARKKEQTKPENHQSARIVRYYYVSSLDYLNGKMSTIINLCEVEKARAYINLNGKNINKIGTEINFLAGLYLKNDEKKAWKSIYDRAFSNLAITGNKTWVIDVDNPNDDLSEFIRITKDIQPIGNKHIATINTPNGRHWIVKPFDLNTFTHAIFSLCLQNTNSLSIRTDDIKKDNPTLLYFPHSLT